ncbi:L,D-transpeptidase family protein [Streptomyces pactum]|uniref:L,D-transpeptidase family protein n=1 Tax=Streptomyces pactum TaxID=68249 RepID=UPI0036FC918E
MRTPGTPILRRTALAAAAGVLLAGCGGPAGQDGGRGGGDRGGTASRTAAPGASPTADPTRIPGVGDTLHARIPADSGQVVAVYGRGPDSADATVVLYTRRDGAWQRTRQWSGHNGKRGWTTDHRQGDRRSPVGVFTLSDAGGVLPDPGARLPYTADPAFAAPRSWSRSHWHDFDYVIAIDYNRVRGTSPLDPTRPQGQEKGGSIWLHLDHGSGTSGCVSLPRSGMEYLLRTVDPAQHPVVVMGDRAHLAA